MRYRECFSLYRRKMRSGKSVWYYQCYDENGVRVCGHSTEQTTRTAAREYCIRLVREHKLVRERGINKIPTFGEFAKGFWNFQTSEYLCYIKTRRPISQRYANMAEGQTNNYILETFRHIPLDKITENMVDSWLVSMPSKGLRASTANVAFSTFKTMMNWAVKKRLIKFNPCNGVKNLKEQEKNREIITPFEVQKLFGSTEGIWSDTLYYRMCKLAACTGMRVAEVIGLRGKYVFEKPTSQ